MRGPARFGWILGLLGAVGLVGVGTGGPAAAATSTVPYTDPAAVGYLGICNQAGQQVTSGNVDATPFVWRVVSSVPAKKPYSNAERTATLEAFLPVQGLSPGDWSGETLTAASRYSNPTSPMAAATDTDSSLEDFIEAFPPKWDGLIQLRLYLSTAGQAADTTQYAALNIQVVGTTWHAVGGGPVDCSAGTAESLETILLPATTTLPSSSSSTSQGSSKNPPTTAPSRTQPSTSTSTSRSGPSSATTGGGQRSGPTPAQGTKGGGTSPAGPPGSSTPPAGSTSQAAARVRVGSGPGTGVLVGVIAGGLVLLALALTGVVRRRKRGLAAAGATPVQRAKLIKFIN